MKSSNLPIILYVNIAIIEKEACNYNILKTSINISQKYGLYELRK